MCIQDNLLIRQEEDSDQKIVFELIKNTFKTVDYSDGNEHYLVERLRKCDAFIPNLSLVAVFNNEIVGHILFSKVKVGDTVQFALAPLTVSIEYQRQGIGKRLIYEGHRIARLMGYQYSIVLGDPKYYSHFGYIQAENFGIKSPFDLPKEFFMAFNLQDNIVRLNGKVEYPKEFLL